MDPVTEEGNEKNLFSRKMTAIWKHPLFQSSFQRIQEWEKDRIYCRHGMEHFLDTARIAYIRSLEETIPVSKDQIYAAALLHDIGKWQQYEDGTPHEIASARIASCILKDIVTTAEAFPGGAWFSPEDIRQILTAIRGHRTLRSGAEPLERLLYESDKASRACFHCAAKDSCEWPETKKNKEIFI